MLENFKTASLIDMQLPPSLKEKLWREKLVNNPALMDVISTLSKHYATDERTAAELVEDAIRVSKTVSTHAGNFFSYRNNVVPAEAYYALLARFFIQTNPEWFTHLTDGYRDLSKELDLVDETPSLASNIRIGRLAKFCHYIELAAALTNYRNGLRSGKISLKLPNSHNNGNHSQEWQKRYELVDHVKSDIREGHEIVGDIRRLTIDIDQFLNHLDDDFSWHMRLGAEHQERVLDNDFLFDHLSVNDVGRIRETFNLTYEFYKAKHRDDPFAAFYEFSEECFSPFHIFRSSFQPLTEKSAVSALAHDALSHNGDSGLVSRLPGTTYNAFKTASFMSGLARSSMRMWGSAKTPFILSEDMENFHDLLLASADRLCPGTVLDDSFQRHRAKALDVYNGIARQHDIEAISP